MNSVDFDGELRRLKALCGRPHSFVGCAAWEPTPWDQRGQKSGFDPRAPFSLITIRVFRRDGCVLSFMLVFRDGASRLTVLRLKGASPMRTPFLKRAVLALVAIAAATLNTKAFAA